MNCFVFRIIFFLSILSSSFFALDIHAQSGSILTGSSDQSGLTLSGGIRESKTGTGNVGEESLSGSSTLSEKEKAEIREAVNELVTTSLKRAVENYSSMVEEKYSTDESKIAAYERIKGILYARITRINENKDLSESGKKKFRLFMKLMIEMIDEKIEELR